MSTQGAEKVVVVELVKAGAAAPVVVVLLIYEAIQHVTFWFIVLD